MSKPSRASRLPRASRHRFVLFPVFCCLVGLLPIPASGQDTAPGPELGTLPDPTALPPGTAPSSPIEKAKDLVAQGELEQARQLLAQAEREAGGRAPTVSVFLAAVCNLEARNDEAIEAAERALSAVRNGAGDRKWTSEAHFQRGLASMASLAGLTQDKERFRQRLGMAIESFEKVATSGSIRAPAAHLRLLSQVAVLAALPDTPEAESRRYFAQAWALAWSWLDRSGALSAPGSGPGSTLDAETQAALTYLCGTGDCVPAPRLEEGEDPDPETRNILDLRAGSWPGVTRPRKLEATAPAYTERARTAGARGEVRLRAVINERGEVEQPRIVQGLPYGLSEAAADAVRQWRFTPATREGEPVPVYYYLAVEFRLN